MASKPDQFNELQKKNLEAAMRLAQLSIENSQKIMELQVQTAKSLFEEGVQNAKALTTIKDPKDMMNLRTAYAQSTAEKMLSCAKAIAEITAATQAEVGKMVGEQLSTGSTDVFEAMQKMFKGMPITDQNAMGAIQTAMDTTRAAFEQMSKASADAFQSFTQMTTPAATGKGKK
jgi:phasin family protein